MVDLQRIGTDTIRMERLLDAPVDAVWRWLVEPDLRAQWFAGGDVDLREGGTLHLVFDHDNLSEDDVPYPADFACHKGAAATERVIRVDKPRLFSFSWDGGKEGVASFELSDAGGGKTRLVLTHSGITGPAPMANFGGGWHSHLAVLQAKLAGRSVRDFWALHRESEAAVAEALAEAPAQA
jgi:uncharacterized protein YndB with AHSA1/START domain